MAEHSVANVAPYLSEQPAERLSRHTGRLAGQLASLIEHTSSASSGALTEVRSFLSAMAAAHDASAPVAALLDEDATHALDRIVAGYGLSPVEVDVMLLAGMPEEHEGYGSAMRALHPRGEPRPSAGLAAQLLCRSAAERTLLRQTLETGRAASVGMLTITGDGPFWERSLGLCDALWPALLGIDAWPSWLGHERELGDAAGLDDWFAEPATQRAAQALADGTPRLILITADDEEVAAERAIALASHAEVPNERLTLPAAMGEQAERIAGIHCALRGSVPVLKVSRIDGPNVPPAPMLADFPGPVVVCARRGQVAVQGTRPVVSAPVTHMRGPSRMRMWSASLPELNGHAATLAARYTIEPSSARSVAADVRSIARLQQRRASIDDVADAVRTRSNVSLTSGVSLITPSATWDDLVLPPASMRHLREIIGRFAHQGRVLDEWGFLERRRGARGVRALFAGPPGTGKTLSAEVIADALGVDLLVVDISRVVSKWIGETEKNLADVFDTAERTQAVLLFDEADALFGKRTEVKDAHDRYANLETAYLLTRLERFEGLAILATNLRQHIDPAFTRRLEFVLDFAEPNAAEREALWRCHLPARAPLADDVRLKDLASLYPIVGGLIRNASVAAAFLATADDTSITTEHLVRAIRREYEKVGRAFPGAPAGSASH